MYINAMFGAHMLMMQPSEPITVPAILTLRHPNLPDKTLTIGPGKTSKHYNRLSTVTDTYTLNKQTENIRIVLNV